MPRLNHPVAEFAKNFGSPATRNPFAFRAIALCLAFILPAATYGQDSQDDQAPPVPAFDVDQTGSDDAPPVPPDAGEPSPTAGDEPPGANVYLVDEDDVEAAMQGPPVPEPGAAEPSGISLLTLIYRGGWFILPIALMSVLVVMLAVERFISLRRNKIIPPRLIQRLGEMVRSEELFNPEQAYELCRERSSPTAHVVAAMLQRTGQPLASIETAASETIQREADRYAAPVRWLTLAAAATPLMGLLGTVWGMIVAFHESSTLSADQSRSEQLSEGIYTALVTTLAGLAVAIPAAILAQYLENRIAKLFHRIEELAFRVAPVLGQFVGRSRLDDSGRLRAAHPAGGLHGSPVAPPPPAPPMGYPAAASPVAPPVAAS